METHTARYDRRATLQQTFMALGALRTKRSMRGNAGHGMTKRRCVFIKILSGVQWVNHVRPTQPNDQRQNLFVVARMLGSSWELVSHGAKLRNPHCRRRLDDFHWGHVMSIQMGKLQDSHLICAVRRSLCRRGRRHG